MYILSQSLLQIESINDTCYHVKTVMYCRAWGEEANVTLVEHSSPLPLIFPAEEIEIHTRDKLDEDSTSIDVIHKTSTLCSHNILYPVDSKYNPL